MPKAAEKRLAQAASAPRLSTERAEAPMRGTGFAETKSGTYETYRDGQNKEWHYMQGIPPSGRAKDRT